jgi:hypothetical protein
LSKPYQQAQLQAEIEKLLDNAWSSGNRLQEPPHRLKPAD